MDKQAADSFSDFWPIYVRAHGQPLTRLFHCAGTLAGWAFLISAIIFQNVWLVPAGLAAGYTFAWISHFFVEHNRPATFGHPFWSWLADQKMVALMLAGKMGEEVRRCTIQN
jgi:hypothetical protein